jgi:hypothetical protein
MPPSGGCLPRKVWKRWFGKRYIYIYILTFDLASALTKQPSNSTKLTSKLTINSTSPGLHRGGPKQPSTPIFNSATPGLDHGGTPIYLTDHRQVAHGSNSISASPGLCHAGNTCSTLPGLCHGGNSSSTSPGRYPGGNINLTSPGLCQGGNIS